MSETAHPHLDDTLKQLRQAQRRQPMPDATMRRTWLRALEALMRDNADAICAAIDADFDGRPVQETQLLELFPSLQGLRHARRRLGRWTRPRRHMADFWFLPARTMLLPRPLGVVGIIVPWNYPLYLAVGPMVDALAAGNRVMVKMSEYTPRFSALFAELVARYFPEGNVQVVTGDASVGQAFSALPFDHLLFTGSTAVGRHVMRAASANLTPVTLELGGKSPALIGPDARFDKAVERIVYAKCVNAGQTCIAPDYVLIPRGREGAFIETARGVVKRFYPDLAEGRQYANVIDANKHARLKRLRDEAVAAGAQAHELGAGTTLNDRRVMPPTALTDVPDAAEVMHEEIFGPLLPLVPYDTVDDALAYIAARPHPLALYLFDDDRGLQRRVMRECAAGGVAINDALYHIAQHHLPFGGVGTSGMGAYHGEDGFRTFSKMLPVFRQARLNGVGLLNPPYGKRFRQLLGLLLGR